MRRVAIALAALAFAAFICAKGIPTLRHDWNWPVDRLGVPSFIDESIGGWLSVGFGVANPHPTTYLVALPIALCMWLFGPLVALAGLAATTAYCVLCAAQAIARRVGAMPLAAFGAGLFALFNPWVYNEVVAGHVLMVLAYGGAIGLIGEMSRGRAAGTVRLALWMILIDVQLQFFILATIALLAFGVVTRRWMPAAIGALIALPSLVGLIAERTTLVQIPYGLAWQTNQSVAPLALAGLGGYFAHYADRLGPASFVAVCVIVALALAGVFFTTRRVAAGLCVAAAALLFLFVTGVNGPLDVPYAWLVRRVPESGVFRELYDLAGILATLLILPACAAAARVRSLGYVIAAAGAVLTVTWFFNPPSSLWVGASAFPRPPVAADAYSRVAFLPAFQPLALRSGVGDGADPDAIVYPHHVDALNQYLPSYPVDMALGAYEQTGDATMLRALGVGEIVGRPWFVSRSNGAIGLAATSLSARAAAQSLPAVRRLQNVTPLISQCDGSQIVAIANRLGDCNVFFGDARNGAVEPIRASSDSVDAASAWIDARLAFARAPELAQGIGGAMTQSSVPHDVREGWLLAFVRGRLDGGGGRVVDGVPGFSWIRIPAGVDSVTCAGLCELVAQANGVPAPSSGTPNVRVDVLPFREVTPFFYVVRSANDSARLLRLNERFDPAWVGLSARGVLPHVRVDTSVNGWFLPQHPPASIVLVQIGALVQLVAELLGLACALALLKALVRAPTKRA